MGGPALPKVNSRWRTAAVLDFPQNAITQQPLLTAVVGSQQNPQLLSLFGTRDIIGHVTIALKMFSYNWSIETNRLSHTDVEILNLNFLGVMTLTIWGHVTSLVT